MTFDRVAPFRGESVLYDAKYAAVLAALDTASRSRPGDNGLVQNRVF
jgi:hypothetical protein